MAAPTTDEHRPGAPHRLQLAAVCLGLTLLVFSQSAGLEAADTKLDLVVTPWRFLVHSVSMWDPTAAAGQLQNQAYGYLFPMGPFFLLGHLMALPPWVTQRAWESAIVVVAFLGVFRLSRLLGIEGFWPRVAAGLAYALAPRMIMELGTISSELMPVAAAPWVLIPLVVGSRTGSPRRNAAKSGIALLFAGGVNAAATVAILPIPILWLITRSRGQRRAALTRWWTLAVAMACLWWAIPLVVLGKYAAPFLTYIESSSVTTSQTSLATSLRGVEHWEAYLGQGIWPAGFVFVTLGVVILATAALSGLGVVGIALRRTPHRTFLVSCVAVGLIAITLGHVATVEPLFAPAVRRALDGPLDAFRNVHKFDPVLRLPLALGVGYVVAALMELSPKWARARSLRAPVRAIALIAVAWVSLVAVAPAFANDMVPQTRTQNDPSWWAQTADWLAQQGGGRTLVVPGAATPVYYWGSPSDDALQPYARSPWTVRNSVPLTQPGYIRLLNEIDVQLAAGRPDPTLAPVLARSGIRFVAVRNDLDTALSGATPLPFVHLTLDESPGLRKVATFGPSLTGNDPNRLTDLGATTPSGAVTIYENSLWRGRAALLPATATVVANGSADNLPGLTAAGLRPDQPVIFGAEPSALTAAVGPVPMFLDDGIRRREFGFGSTGSYSATLSADEPFRETRAAHDYLPTPTPPLSTVAYSGIAGVSASSSGADVDASVNIGVANGPWAAIDGHPSTAWRVGSFYGAVGQWWQVDLDSPITTPTVTIRFAGDGKTWPDKVQVDTSSGHLVEGVAPDGHPQPLALPPGPASFLRITFLHMADGSPGYSAGIRSLRIPGVSPSRTLQVPGSFAPAKIVFTIASGTRPQCLTVDGAAACSQSWPTEGEEGTTLDRSFTLSKYGQYDTALRVRMRPGRALDNALDAGNPIRAIATSTQSTDPRERPGAAVDGVDTTGWVAAPSDPHPALQLSTAHAGVLTGLVIRPITGAPTTTPTRVLITAGKEFFAATLPADGLLSFPRPAKTRSVTIEVLHATLRTNNDTTTGQTSLLPVGIGEVDLIGANAPTGSMPSSIDLPCGQGPALVVDGTTVPTRLKAPSGRVLNEGVVTARPCATTTINTRRRLDLTPGPHRLTLNASALTQPQSMVLTNTAAQPPPAELSVPQLHELDWGSTRRTVGVSTAAAAVFVVRENFNAGWRATLHGKTLAPLMIDGWQQAWLVPAGSQGIIHLVFTPQRVVSAGLIGGAAAALALVPLALIRPRRRRPHRKLEPLRDGQPNAVIAWIALIGVLTLLGSLAGLVIGVAAFAVSRLGVFRRSFDRVPWVLGALVSVIVLAQVAAPAGSAHALAGSAGIQVLCLVVVAGLLLCCIIPGRSTPRGGESP